MISGRNSSVNFDELYKQRVFVLTTTLLGTKIPTFLKHTFWITEQLNLWFCLLYFVKISKNLKQSYLRTCLLAQCDLIFDKKTVTTIAGLDISQPQHWLDEER